jgi:hypothetical protein
MNIITNWSKTKKGIVNFFKGNKIKTKEIQQTIPIQNVPEPVKEEKKKREIHRAFKNRKNTNGRYSQYVPMYKDSMGNIHYKLICHSY